MMAVIETKYSVGDVVYRAGTTTTAKQHPCPDCGDSRKWKAVSPAGNEYEFACPRCGARYLSNDDLSLKYTAHVADVQRLTIGSVRFNSASGSWDQGARYMCRETGVGSGTVYAEEDLFETKEAAQAAAETKAATANVTIPHIVERYNKTLELSDYQLENAALKQAAKLKSRAGSMLWNMNELFTNIEEADDKDAILEAIEDYKRWRWERDKSAAVEPEQAA